MFTSHDLPSDTSRDLPAPDEQTSPGMTAHPAELRELDLRPALLRRWTVRTVTAGAAAGLVAIVLAGYVVHLHSTVASWQEHTAALSDELEQVTDQRDRAVEERDEAAGQVTAAETARDDALEAQRTAESAADTARATADELQQLLDSSEHDSAELERRIDDLASEKAQVEDDREFVRIARDQYEGLVTVALAAVDGLDSCNDAMASAMPYVANWDLYDPVDLDRYLAEVEGSCALAYGSYNALLDTLESFQ